ncbi:hypothetical protein ACFPYJ_06315 [Paenibacillus solisilvae]|uniref:Sugar ABC transporter permease n=1 Tax=Paenibacillus solisilvae TaxID=2486751 RepID=A0ABW0VW34_9BACL
MGMFWIRAVKDFKLHKYLYLMALPMIVFYIVFHYTPMYGAVIAFKDFKPTLGARGWDSSILTILFIVIIFGSF